MDRTLPMSVVAALLFAAGAAGQVTVVPSSVVARVGDPAPTGRTPADVFDSFIFVQAVNNAGQSVFAAAVRPAAGGIATTSLWTTRAGAHEMIALAGQVIAPAVDPVRAWAPFDTSTRPFIADNGRIVVAAKAVPQFAPGPYSHTGLLATEPGGPWSLVFEDATAMPGRPGETANVLLFQPSVRADNGRVMFLARSSPSNVWYCLAEGDDGLAIVDAVPFFSAGGTSGVVSVTSSGDFAYGVRLSQSATIRGRSSAQGQVLAADGQALTFVNTAGEWTLVLTHADHIMNNGAGDFLVEAVVRPQGGIPGTERAAALRFSGGSPVLLAMQGEPTERPGLQWGDLSASVPVVCDSGESAWWTKVQGEGVAEDNNAVLALFGAGPDPTAQIIARGGDPVSDLPGWYYGNGFQVSLTPYGRLHFSCTIHNGPGGAPTPATFALDNAGRVRLLASAFATSMVLPGGAVQLTDVTGSLSSGGNDGSQRQISSSGGLLSRVRYSGGEALVVLSVPCPADIAATGGVPGYDGVMDNNDFVVFIDWFFSGDMRADRGVVGGEHGSDGQLDNNDFIVFVDLFFNGCE